MTAISSGSVPPVAEIQPRPHMVGLWYHCAAWGNLAANCPVKSELHIHFSASCKQG